MTFSPFSILLMPIAEPTYWLSQVLFRPSVGRAPQPPNRKWQERCQQAGTVAWRC